MGHTVDMTWRMVTPTGVRHMQYSLLSVSLTWGLSYLMPPDKRIPFSEVFPDKLATASLLPMPAWGALMVTAAAVGIIAEAFMRNDPANHRNAMWTSCVVHWVLFLVYGTLTLAAWASGLSQVQWHHWPDVVPNLVSAISRPFLWGALAFMHHLFANQPKPRKES